MKTIVSVAALLGFLLGGRLAQAQTRWLAGYCQNAPLWGQDTELSPGGVSDLNRFRLTSTPVFGRLSFELAYEQVVTFRQNKTSNRFLGGVPSGGEWLALQWTLQDNDHIVWRHRFDRLNVRYRPSRAVDLTAGRQTVSWATTLFLTPADPFSPFSPADPFREFRAGVDGVRVRVHPGPLSEVDVVIRPTKNDRTGEEFTMLGRGLTAWRGWELSGWGGSLYGDVTGAFGAAGSVLGVAVRAEGVVRRIDDDTVFRGTIGIDRRLTLGSRDLYVVLEYQRDCLGAASSDEYVKVLKSDPFLRGELQVLGRDELAFQASYRIHPLWSLAALWLRNLNDKSMLFSPTFAYSASDEASVMGGVFFGFGDDGVTDTRPLPSEYGLAGATLFLSVSLFF